MIIIDSFKNEKMKNPHGVNGTKLYEFEHGTFVHLTLNPNQNLKPHATPVDVIFYILEGSPFIEIGDEKVKVNKDNLIFSPANILHCIYNESDTIARILVCKVPKPTKPTKFVNK